jgi:Bacterial Ig-like domain (group 3)
MNTRITKRFFGGRGVAAIGGFLVATCAAWSLMAGVALAGPLNTTPPTISPTGTPREAQTLTGTKGTWADPTATISDQWESCFSGTCSPVGTADNLSYTVAATDVGHTILLRETATDAVLVPPSTTVDSAATLAVLPLPPPVNTALPTIAGTAQLGQILTLTQGAWTNSPTIANQWEDCTGATCTAIPGATGPTYTVAVGDIGHTIDVLESASNDGTVTPVMVHSAQTGVAVAPPTNSTPPTITGTPQQGQVLTVTPGVWINSPTSFTEQWRGCAGLICTPIPGQTGTSYTVGPGDVGHTIEVVETAFNAAAPLGLAATSGPTGTASTTSTTSVVAFTQNGPTTNQAVTLIATVTSNSPNANPHGSLSFFNGLGAIPGCAGMPVNGSQTTITVACQASFAAGTAQVSAAYVADPTSLVNGSSSSATPLGVGKGGTSVLLAVTPKVAPGGRATYLATLVPASNAGPRLPGGSIEFLDGGQPIGTCASQSLSNLTATCTVSYKSPGTHTISALYTGDANFTGSTSSTSGVQIVKGAPKTPTVHGSLGSTLAWTIYYHPRYSEFTVFKAFAVAKGTSIIVHCYGKDCPFAKWSLAKPSGTLSLLRRLRHRHLRAGTQITVRLIRTHWFGWYYSFTMRAGRAPLTKRACIAPGTLKPGCTSRHR